jgi:branched-chain amino acid transport system permease protein
MKYSVTFWQRTCWNCQDSQIDAAQKRRHIVSIESKCRGVDPAEGGTTTVEDAARLLQLVVNGAAAGCIYGLIALGFVLIYKATEMINFAQGDIMMLGGFVAFSLIAHFGLNYWIGSLLAIAIIAAFGFALDAIILRRVIGQPQFAVVMLTLGLGFIFRAYAGITWGYDSVGFNTPFTNKTLNLSGMVLGLDNVSIIIGTVLLCGVLYMFFSRTRLGIAMQASSQNQLAAYYMGIPVRTVFSLIWAISAGVAAVAGILLSPVSMIDVNMGFLGIKAFAAAVLGGFGSIPGALVGGVVIGIVEQLAGYFLPAGFQEVTSNVVLLATLILRPQGLFAEGMGKRV